MDAETAGEAPAESSEKISTYDSPYYQENFLWIINTVVSEPEFQHLFSEDGGFSAQTVAEFDKLESCQQRLYVRLILRKPKWLKRGKIGYEKEFGSVAAVSALLVALADIEFLERQMYGLTLEETLNLLSSSEIAELASQFRLKSAGVAKGPLIALFKKMCQEQRTPFGLPLTDIVRRKAVDLLGLIYRVENRRKAVFTKALSLFQLTAGITSSVGQNPIFGLLQMNLGNTKFPPFELQSGFMLFPSLAEFTSFTDAQQLFEEISCAIEAKDFSLAKVLYLKALPAWEEIISDSVIQSAVCNRPLFLRKFTAGYFYTRTVERGVEALERLDEESDAINGYIQLLDQTTYVTHHRGEWFNRLTILMLRIDKNSNAVAKMLLRGIKDPALRPHQRLELTKRLQRILKHLGSDVQKEATKLLATLTSYKAPVIVEIRGKLCATEKMGKGKSVFIRDAGETLVCSVEELALAHYRDHGYSEGIHAEGAVFTSLYGILFWDVIYENLPDVFRSKYQTAPLDLTCSSFYPSRQAAIERRVQFLSASTSVEIAAAVTDIWEKHRGTECAAIHWDTFPSLDFLLGLLICLEAKQLASVCERYARDFGAVRAGFPDLTVWNSDEKKLKVVEVKGPNDRLSHKQIIWIDFLMGIGIPVEVCHVTATGSKRKSFE